MTTLETETFARWLYAQFAQGLSRYGRKLGPWDALSERCQDVWRMTARRRLARIWGAA